MAEGKYIPFEDGLQQYARELRHTMTPQERALWYNFLRRYSLKFLRQKPLGPYIVDFFCYRAMLVIEVDGGGHYEAQQMAYDLRRTEYLQRQGYLVCRYTNAEVNANFATVCAEIDRVAQKRKR